MWSAHVLTLFPEMFPGALGHSIAKKASEKEIWSLTTHDIRAFAQDKHHTVDDTPYGGGSGMVLRSDVLDSTLQHALTHYDNANETPIFLMSPRGIPLNQKILKKWTTTYQTGGVFICPRYEGIDQRFIDYWSNKTPHFYEVSVGDYILSGGDLAAQILIDAWVRLLPNVLNDPQATEIESFTLDLLEFSQYTRPRVWNGMEVPKQLLSGHHAQIDDWRKEESHQKTKERRPDLWKRYQKNETEVESK